MDTLEPLIEKAQSLGFKLNNLCQRADGSWQANFLVDVRLGAEFGIGHTAREALGAALAKAIAKRPAPPAAGVFD